MSTYNYKTLLPNTSDGGSNAHTPNMTDTLAELKAALANSSYVNVVADALVFDTDVYGVTGSPTDYSKFQKAINDTELKISSVGTYDLSASLNAPQVGTAVFKKLTIDTKETGTIRVSGVKCGEIVVNAPNAEVIVNNSTIKKNSSAPTSTGSLIVEDVLNGTLTLTKMTIGGDLEIKDSSNGGAVAFGADTTIAGDVIVNTADEVALSIDNSAAKVVIKKAATVDFTNSVKIAKITVDSNGVKLLSDVTTDYTKLATTVEKAKEVTDDLKITASDAQASTKKFVDAVEALEGTVLGSAAAGTDPGATIDLTTLDGYSDGSVSSSLNSSNTVGLTLSNNVITIPNSATTNTGAVDIAVKSGSATIYYTVTVSVTKADDPSNGTYTVSVALDKTTAVTKTEELIAAYIADPTNDAKYEAATNAIRVYLATYTSAATGDLTNYDKYVATPTELAELAQAESIIRSYSATNKLAVSTGVSELNIQTALRGLAALTNLNNLDVSSLSVGSKDSNDEYPITITGKTNTAVTATINLPEAYVEVQP